MSDRPFLTIGMATFQDFNGVYFSIQAIRLNNPSLLRELEFVIIDNSPGSEDSGYIQGLLGNMASSGARVKYIEMTSPQGTSPSRNRIFQEATGEHVLVMDCHVLLDPLALPTLIQYLKDQHNPKDILSGPMIYDSLIPGEWASHYANKWRAEMWGIWESAWTDGEKIFGVTEDATGNCIPVSVDMKRESMLSRFYNFPTDLKWAGHERKLYKEGFWRIGMKPDDKPFEIPGQGLGLFVHTRETWPEFHPQANGFGGEELWIHEKVRKAGGKALCIPHLKWLHRFARPGGIKYAGVTKGRKMRNYVLEFQQLGMDLEPIYKHFVEELGVSPSEWDALLEDPINWQDSQAKSSCGGCGAKKAPEAIEAFSSQEDLLLAASKIGRDLNEHIPLLKEYAEKCEHITEFSERRDSFIGLITGNPKKLISHNTEYDNLSETAVKLSPSVELLRDQNINTKEILDIEETDLLFLDLEHTFEAVYRELHQYHSKVRKYIIVHDTDIFGNKGQDNGPGILKAIAQFCRENPQWRVHHHTKQQFGLTILSCLKDERPSLPPLGTRLWNFGKALIEHVATPDRAASEELTEQRLNVCATCPHRNNTSCSVCGCVVNAKATWKDQDCPLALWPLPQEVEVKDE